MLDELGVVSNSWAGVLDKGIRFEDLAGQFAREGFSHLEIRDADYLRRSNLGGLFDRIEGAMDSYSDAEWKTICEDFQLGREANGLIKPDDAALADDIRSLLGALAGLRVSYAISHPWLTAPDNEPAAERRMIKVIKLTYLLCSFPARLRLVAPFWVNGSRSHIATKNLKRYRKLLPEYSLTYAVENGLGASAVRVLEWAMAGGFVMAYDEANIYGSDGAALHDPEAFWRVATMESLTSIHLKQKDQRGFLPILSEGFVDFGAMFKRLRGKGYRGDWLLELSPVGDPLNNALQSWAFLSKLI